MDMSVWFLMGTALVFFMQCGFAMVEAGFTRAKNVGNITMKNLMDFCIGTVAFYLLGYNLLCGDGKFVGWGLNPFTNFGETDWSAFVFNLVFCATAATIVSGAMAERTKFITYCIYSFIISLCVYPIEAHWVWGGTPWLTDMGFTDFAGSACIHMVGGITAFIGAAMLGPRIGKYDKNGKPKPILGHNLLIGALGVFILWFGWYGFNGRTALRRRCTSPCHPVPGNPLHRRMDDHYNDNRVCGIKENDRSQSYRRGGDRGSRLDRARIRVRLSGFRIQRVTLICTNLI